MTDMQAVFQLVKTMTPEELEELAQFLEAQRDQVQNTPQQPRILGLHANTGPFWISDDFNDPLPDAFWFGEG
ncbi:MAG: DUF2281 domain-containing protein [Anaerolineae bacterium]|nr:DUF2281 domain-containing protein [Anaerolineae bacterium]